MAVNAQTVLTQGQKAQGGRWAQLVPVISAHTRWRQEDGESVLSYMGSPAWAAEFLNDSGRR